MTPEEMQEMYTALQKSYYSGILSVSYADHSVTYRSMKELLDAMTRLEAALGLGGPRDPLNNRKTGVFYKGL